MNKRMRKPGESLIVYLVKSAVDLFPSRNYLDAGAVRAARREWMEKSVMVRYGNERLQANRRATLRVLNVGVDTLAA